MLCKYCEYEWSSRVREPKACPRCKRRLDYEKAKSRIVDIRKLLSEVNADAR